VLSLQTILCPIDFSDASFEALSTAIKLALHFHAKLCLAHVLPPVVASGPVIGADPTYLLQDAKAYSEELRADAEKKLREIIEHRIALELEVRSVVAFGDAATEIVQLADTEAAGVIVISTHGLTGWRHLVFGSVAEKVVQLSHRPVLVIPASQPKEERFFSNVSPEPIST
jgi:nucleotide-binding universal stress UspA family protein